VLENLIKYAFIKKNILDVIKQKNTGIVPVPCSDPVSPNAYLGGLIRSMVRPYIWAIWAKGSRIQFRLAFLHSSFASRKGVAAWEASHSNVDDGVGSGRAGRRLWTGADWA
jgi:hypothetical protein